MNTVHPFQALQAPTVDELAVLLQRAKDKENDARLVRLDIEAQILELVGVDAEGTKTVKGDQYQLSTTGKVNRTIDQRKLSDLKSKIPTPLFKRLISYTPKLNLKEYRFIEANEPDYFALIAPAVTSKPAKPSVSIKEVS